MPCRFLFLDLQILDFTQAPLQILGSLADAVLNEASDLAAMMWQVGAVPVQEASDRLSNENERWSTNPDNGFHSPPQC